MNRLILCTLLLALLVTACGDRAPTTTSVITQAPLPVEADPYPASIDRIPSGSIPWYPAPGTPGAPAPGMLMTTGFEPQPGDVNLTRNEVYLELDSSQLLIMESYPIQVVAILTGNLPDPCHRLRVAVTAADANNHINLDMYSLTSNDTVCTTVLEPFAASIPLGTYAGGHFSVYVNGELLGEFDS